MINFQKKWLKSIDVSVISVLVIGLILRSVIAYFIYAGYDESYYYVYSHQLDWSYYDHPLFVALSTGFGTWISGIVNQFTIRWGALILYTGSLWLLYLTGKRLFNPQAAKLSLILASIIPVFLLVFGIFSLPDAPLIFFWSATLYCAACEFFATTEQSYQPSYRLTILSILVGLACLSKYHGFILGLGLVIFCLTLPRYQKVFRSGWMWLGFGLFILTIFPLLYWNLQHNWISFQFHLSNRFDKPKHFKIFGSLGFIVVSILMMFPPIGLSMWWITGKTFVKQVPTFFSRKAFRKRNELDDRQWLILCVSAPLIIGFSLISSYIYIAPSWALPGFWTPTLLLGDWLAQWQQQSKRTVNRWLKGSGIAIITLMLLVLLHLNLGVFQKPSQYALFGGVVSPKLDPSTEVLDLEQLQDSFANEPLFSTALANSQFVFTHLYYLGGLIDIAIHPLKPIPVTCFCRDPRGFTVWYDPKEWLGKNGLFITTKRFAENLEVIDRYRPYFKEFQKLGDIPIKRGSVVIDVFYVYQGKGFLKVYP